MLFFDLTNCINEAIRNNKFPDSLKLSDITPVFKKLGPSDKANYRPVSVLPLLSKVFEKVIDSGKQNLTRRIILVQF